MKAGTDGRSVTFLRHWLRFNVVGAFGITVQMLTLTLLIHKAGISYLPSTAIAVEASVLHNFVWHLRWTWADRFDGAPASVRVMFWRFHLTSGVVSLCGNLLLMRIFVGEMGMNAILANAITIAICALLNFTLSDRYAFA